MLAGNATAVLIVFVFVTSMVLFVILLLGNRQPATDGAEPLETLEFAGPDGRPATLPRIGSVLMPSDKGRQLQLKSRMVQAGLYRSQATFVFLGVKLLVMLVPVFAGAGLAFLGLLPMAYGVLGGVLTGLVGMLASSLWIAMRKKRRQVAIRRALPDALDVVVVCMEGGLSLPASFARVTSELRAVHPLLSTELAIVGREVQLGRSIGQALRQFADRFDVDELRGLASVIAQSERFGASVTKALRIHADGLRQMRYQRAEAQAQKAPVKLIFPTVLCIFPALYIVLMGPAGLVLVKMFRDM